MDSYTAITASMPALRSEIEDHPDRFRILTGERPTGRLHLGHYFGTILERVRLQKMGVETFVVLADYQVIADRDTTANVRGRVIDAVRDYIAAGLDPDRTTIFTHSSIPALNQLLLPFLSLVTEAELHRNPTVKAEAAASGRAHSGLLLTYPVHQAADILFCKGNLIPVGKDNLPHIEQTRVVARRFNDRYAPVFPEPRPLLTDTPELVGLDGRKMSKSYGNTIALGMTSDDTDSAIRSARTDSDRRITYDPARRPEVAALLDTAAICLAQHPVDVADQIGDGGSAGLKAVTTRAVNDRLHDHRQRRKQVSADDALDILRTGNQRANLIAEQTLADVRHAMGTEY